MLYVQRKEDMSDLFVISFDNEHTAFEMRAVLVKFQKEYLIKILKTSLTADKEDTLREVLEKA